MGDISPTRRTLLRRCVAAGSLSVTGVVGVGAHAGGQRTTGTVFGIETLAGEPVQTSSRADCTPGHSDSDPPCEQIDDDAESRTAFPTGGTPHVVTFDYPCGWRTSTTDQFDDRAQSNVTRDDFDAYIDIQIRSYYDPVEEGFLEMKQSEGSYDTAQFGTTAHAVVPYGGELVHVEFISTMTGTDCNQPRPDFDLVRQMLKSIEPNSESTFADESDAVEPTASVTMSDQLAQDEGTLVVVNSASLPDGGFIGIHDESFDSGSRVDSTIGVSQYLSSGPHSNLRIRLETSEAISGAEDVLAVAHRDTDGNRQFDYVVTDGAKDSPYIEHSGGPVTDRATIQHVTATPVPSATETDETPTPTPPRDDTVTATPPPTSASAPTEAAVTGTDEQGDQTAGSSPGFGPFATLTALIAAIGIGHRRRGNRSE